MGANLKNQGIRFARSLQMLFKTTAMFSAEHSATRMPLQQSYTLLNALAKDSGQFTLGFVDQRIMLNNVLTTERSLQQLENEFLKRGIGAITFQAGITLTAFKRSMGVLTTPAKAIEEAGGLTKYLEQSPVESMRIFPAGKSQMRTESGDTVLDMDSEAYLLAKTLQEIRPAGAGAFQSFESILQSVAMGGQRAGGNGGTGDGGPGGGDLRAFGSGPGAGAAAGGSGGGELAQSPGGAVPGSMGPVGDMVESYLQGALLDPSNAPRHSFVEVARMLQEMRPELVLSRFPPARREQLRAMPPAQMASEIIEDSAVTWAVKHLSTAPTGPDAFIVEEEVVRVLVRTLQSTQTAERLAVKLAKYLTDLSMPKESVIRIQEELAWVTVPESQKIEKLLQINQFGRHQFRRLVELIRELIKSGDKETATRLADHYLETLKPHLGGNPEEISRLPELFSQMASVRSEFWSKSVELLVEALPRSGAGARPTPANQALTGQDYRHWQVLNCMVALAKDVAPYEEFRLIQTVGEAIEKLATESAGRHDGCCRATLPTLLTPSAVERLIEISVQGSDDAAWARLAAPLLRWSGKAAIATLFLQLEGEEVLPNRLVLVRLIGRLGPVALELTRQQLTDERWHVARNACLLLAELKDPDLLQQVAPALRHPDERVQKAAAKIIQESRHPTHGVILAEALPFLQQSVAESVLDELLYLRDPATAPALEQFILRDAGGKTGPLMRAVQALAVIPGEHVEQTLSTILADATLDVVVRRVAMIALVRSSTPASAALLREWLPTAPQDPMAQETENALKALGRTL